MGARNEEYLTYQELLAALPERGRVHLLLGNGFSIACDPIFRYASLYEAAVEAGLSARAQEVFARHGTNNFEGVLRLLEDTEWVAQRYGVAPQALNGIREDVEVVRNTLVQAVTRAHLDHPGLIPDYRKAAARNFIARYHNVFTTNYDLLLYWTVLHEGNPSHQDGFRADAEIPKRSIWSSASDSATARRSSTYMVLFTCFCRAVNYESTAGFGLRNGSPN